jgi:hypothetical protein
VILEGDALEITTALGRMKVEAGKYGNLILDAKSLLRGFGQGMLLMLGVKAIWWPTLLQNLLFFFSKLKYSLNVTQYVC